MKQPNYQVKQVKYGEKTVQGRVVGRDKVVIPEEEFYKLACLHTTWKDLSDFFGVPVGTLRDNFADLYIKGTQTTKQKLRQKMFETAMNGDRVMMIWLSKNWLGYSDNGPQEGNEEDNMLPWTEKEEEK
jgi:hypothetical protein|tara:strand:+ start:226 stop:612 length:387 start_codon:yes stop_codon:yes gene_type:complete